MEKVLWIKDIDNEIFIGTEVYVPVEKLLELCQCLYKLGQLSTHTDTNE